MNIWTGLLFLEGAVQDVELARELSATPAERARGVESRSDVLRPVAADAREAEAARARSAVALRPGSGIALR